MIRSGQTWTIEIDEAEVKFTVRDDVFHAETTFVRSRRDPELVALLDAFGPIFERAKSEKDKAGGRA